MSTKFTCAECNSDCRGIRKILASEIVEIEESHKYSSSSGKCSIGFVSFTCNTRLITQWKVPMHGTVRSMGYGEKEVISLSRMIKVGAFKTSKLLKRIFPIFKQMGFKIIVTYSDSSLGHTGNVYKLSGFTRDGIRASRIFVKNGKRVSPCIAGRKNVGAENAGTKFLTRWIKKLA